MSLVSCGLSSVPAAQTPPAPSVNEAQAQRYGLRALYFEADQPGKIVYFDGLSQSADFSWNLGDKAAEAGAKELSANWSGVLRVDKTSDYTFSVASNAETTLSVDGQLIAAGESVNLEAGKEYWIQVAAGRVPVAGSMRLQWSSAGTGTQAVPAQLLTPEPVRLQGLGAQALGLNQNVLTNPGFESGFSGWLVSSTKPELVSIVSPGNNSTKALKILPGDINNVAYFYTYDTGIFAPGGTYRFTVDIKTEGAANCSMALSGKPGTVFDAQIQSTASKGWQTVSRDYTLPYLKENLATDFRNENSPYWNGKTGSCFFDNASVTRIADPAPVPEPFRNLIVNGEAERSATTPTEPAGWTKIYPTSGIAIITPGYGGTATAFGATSYNSYYYRQVVPAASMRANSDYILKAWMKGTTYGCSIKAVSGGVTQGFLPLSSTAWTENGIKFKTGATVSDVDVQITGSQCDLDKIRFGPVANDSSPSAATAAVGFEGGEVTLGNAKVTIMKGVFFDPASVKIETLAATPLAVPAPYIAGTTYKVTSDKPTNLLPLLIRLPHQISDENYIDEVYEFINGDYVIQGIGGSKEYFDISVVDSLKDQATKPFQTTYVVVRVLKKAVVDGFLASGGVFNGFYGECPAGTRAYFAKCQAVSLLGQSLNAQSNPKFPGSYRVLSLQAGNAGPPCIGTFYDPANYNVKLCKLSIESRVRDEIINKSNPDIIIAQEMWNGDCASVGVDASQTGSDRVCDRLLNVKDPNTGTQLSQTKRLFDPKIYDTKCAVLANGNRGYECVAVRRSIFSFTVNSPNITVLPGKIANVTGYCSEDKTKGLDTGFFGFSVKSNSPRGNDIRSFDIWNAHLATPAPQDPTNVALFGNIQCRSLQMATLLSAIKSTSQKFLIAGDFNTEYKSTSQGAIQSDILQLRRLSSSWEKKDNLGSNAVSPGWMISDSNQPTAYSSAVVATALDIINLTPLSAFENLQILRSATSPKRFDHLISNFIDTEGAAPCQRISQVHGLDHSSTVCDLYGFDSGSVGAYYRATDLNGLALTEPIPAAIDVDRRGATMPYIKFTEQSNIYNITLPDSLTVRINLRPRCLNSNAASDAAIERKVGVGVNGGTIPVEENVDRQRC